MPPRGTRHCEYCAIGVKLRQYERHVRRLHTITDVYAKDTGGTLTLPSAASLTRDEYYETKSYGPLATPLAPLTFRIL